MIDYDCRRTTEIRSVISQNRAILKKIGYDELNNKTKKP